MNLTWIESKRKKKTVIQSKVKRLWRSKVSCLELGSSKTGEWL